jgi:hypothetical protein
MVYGNGSAGPLTISATTDWTSAPPANFNFQYTDVTVSGNWTVPSGTVIRCTGTFMVDPGYTITVDYGIPLADGNPEKGLSKFPPLGYDIGGIGLSIVEAASILRPGVFAGGTGDDGYTGADGGAGGGSFSVRAQGAITINGTIAADGGDSPLSTNNGSGGGGGGGGFIVFASQTSVTNNGIINARGGDGSDALAANNAGGGGGGGVVHILAPSITEGTVNVSGGSPGGNITPGDTSSSGAGGAMGGNGGRGSYNLGSGGWTAEGGGVGHIIKTAVNNPENLFL